MGQGAYYAKKALKRATYWINQAGQTVTVTRPGAVGQAAAKVQQLPCMPQPLAAEEAVKINLQGGQNALNMMPTNFVFIGTADVAEGDLITWNGHTWRVSSAQGTPIAGTRPILECAAVREG